MSTYAIDSGSNYKKDFFQLGIGSVSIGASAAGIQSLVSGLFTTAPITLPTAATLGVVGSSFYFGRNIQKRHIQKTHERLDRVGASFEDLRPGVEKSLELTSALRRNVEVQQRVLDKREAPLGEEDLAEKFNRLGGYLNKFNQAAENIMRDAKELNVIQEEQKGIRNAIKEEHNACKKKIDFPPFDGWLSWTYSKQ